MRVALFTEYNSLRSYVNCLGNFSGNNTIKILL